MDTNKNIVIGEWFCADLGIAIAERIHDFYYEEYNHIPEDKKVTGLKNVTKNIVTLLIRNGNKS